MPKVEDTPGQFLRLRPSWLWPGYPSRMETGSSWSLHAHIWRTKIAWYVVVTPRRGRRYVAARGVCDRPSDPVDDTYGRHVMEAAYEAYRALGE